MLRKKMDNYRYKLQYVCDALCRLMMALSTKQSEGFSYTRYIPKTAEVA